MLPNEKLNCMKKFLDLSKKRDALMSFNKAKEANIVFDEMNSLFAKFYSDEDADLIFEQGQHMMPDSLDFLSAMLQRGYLPARNHLEKIAQEDRTGMKGFIASMVLSEFDKTSIHARGVDD